MQQVLPDTPNWQAALSDLVMLFSHATLHKHWHFHLSQLVGHRAISVRAEWSELPFPDPACWTAQKSTWWTFALPPRQSASPESGSAYYCQLIHQILWFVIGLFVQLRSGIWGEMTSEDILFIELTAQVGVSPVAELTIILKEAPWKCVQYKLLYKKKKQILERKCNLSKVLHTFSSLAK